MIKPRATYPEDTTFGSRIHENEHAKETVAEYIVDHFLGPGQSAFVSDGSSTFFVGLSLFARKTSGFVLFTNSLPIAHEYPLWETKDWPRDFTLELAGGTVNPKLMMTGRRDCEEIVRQMANRAEWAVLSTRFIFGIEGPAGWESDSLAVKHAALHAPRRVILITDHAKLSQKWSLPVPLIYAVSTEWKTLMNKPTTYVVTNLPPGKTSAEMQEIGRKILNLKLNPKSEEEQYAQNTWPLRNELRNRFCELEIPP